MKKLQTNLKELDYMCSPIMTRSYKNEIKQYLSTSGQKQDPKKLKQHIIHETNKELFSTNSFEYMFRRNPFIACATLVVPSMINSAYNSITGTTSIFSRLLSPNPNPRNSYITMIVMTNAIVCGYKTGCR